MLKTFGYQIRKYCIIFPLLLRIRKNFPSQFFHEVATLINKPYVNIKVKFYFTQAISYVHKTLLIKRMKRTFLDSKSA